MEWEGGGYHCAAAFAWLVFVPSLLHLLKFCVVFLTRSTPAEETGPRPALVRQAPLSPLGAIIGSKRQSDIVVAATRLAGLSFFCFRRQMVRYWNVFKLFEVTSAALRCSRCRVTLLCI